MAGRGGTAELDRARSAGRLAEIGEIELANGTDCLRDEDKAAAGSLHEIQRISVPCQPDARI